MRDFFHLYEYALVVQSWHTYMQHMHTCMIYLTYMSMHLVVQSWHTYMQHMHTCIISSTRASNSCIYGLSCVYLFIYMRRVGTYATAYWSFTCARACMCASIRINIHNTKPMQTQCKVVRQCSCVIRHACTYIYIYIYIYIYMHVT